MANSWAGLYLALAALFGLAAGCGEPAQLGDAGKDSAEERAAADPAEIRDSAPAPFARSFGLTDYATVLGFAVGRSGPLVVAGSAKGPQDIGAGLPAIPTPDQMGTFVLGFGSDGEPRHSQFFTEAAFGAVAVDDAGDTLVTGGHRGRATFAEISSDEAGAYVTRLDPTGHVRWVQLFPGKRAAGHAIAVDAAGNTLVGGVFGKDIMVGGEHLTGADNVFLASLHPSGEIAWAKSFWGETPQNIHQIVMGANGRAVIAGTFSDHLGLGETSRVSNGGTDVFLAAIEPDGHVAWGHTYGGPGDDDPPRLALTPDGSIVVAGSFRGSLDPGTGMLEARGATRVYVARFDRDGRPRRGVALAPVSRPAIAAIAVTPGGSIVLAGTSGGTFEGSWRGAQPFLATLDSEGQMEKLEMLPADPSAELRGLVIEPSGSMLVAGVAERSIALGGRILRGPLLGDQQKNLFLARLSP